MNKLREDLQDIFDNKHLSAREAEKLGATNYQEIIECLDDDILDNETNRDEELEKEKGYKSKVNHSIRHISGLSSKGSLLITILRDNAECVGFIRDMGTTLGLYDSKKFKREKIITGKQWLVEIKKIEEKYKPIDKDKKFIDLLKNFFEELTPQQRGQKYPIEDVYFNSNDEIKNFVLTKKINYEINLFTENLHDIDMMNANLPENPWIAYNYYMTTYKKTKEYRTIFCGTNLLEFFKDKDGADKFTKTKMLSTYEKISNAKKVNRVIPIYIAYCVSRFVELDDLDDAAIKISRFNDFSNASVLNYWKNLFGLMVKNTKYEDIVNFYNDEYLSVFKNDSWDLVTKAIKDLNLSVNSSNEYGTAVDALRLQKFDTGVYMMSLAMCIKFNKDKDIGMDKLISKIVNQYIKALQGKVDWTDEYGNVKTLPVLEYFNGAKKYSSNSINSRVKKLFTYVRNGVLDEIAGKKKDRSVQDKLRDKSLTLFESAIMSNSLVNNIYLFPLSNDKPESELSRINFKSPGNSVEWTHPNDEKNLAIDGFLGMYDDNHHPDWKYKNWIEFGVKSQKDYIIKLLEHNINMKNKTEDVIKKNSLDMTTNFLQVISGTDLEVK